MKIKTATAVLMALLFTGVRAPAQHRGDDLSFQGISWHNAMSARAIGVGGAFTAGAEDLACLFYNPAGLASLERIQASVTAENYAKQWWENQVYRPNRMFITMSMYLERLYIPDPANNGRWDYDVWNEQRDSTYVVNEPELGLDPFSEEAADWQRKTTGSVLNNVSVAVPLRLGDRRLVVSGSYGIANTLRDYDRNDTYLDPHIGYDGYGVATRVTTDTLRVHWFEYERERTGDLREGRVALAADLGKGFSLGLRAARLWGDTKDALSLDKVGWFDLAKDNRMRFSYDTLSVREKGTSSFSSTRVDAGLLLRVSPIRAGFVFGFPYTVRREWSYTLDSAYVSHSARSFLTGTRKLRVPFYYAVGFALEPVQQLELSFDYRCIPYSRASFSPALPDTLHDQWADQKVVAFGAAYRPFQWLTVMAGYRRETETFVPDGKALPDEGPPAESFALGLRMRLPVGWLDLAWEKRKLKYYDSYFSNTNYAVERLQHVLVTYTFAL